LFDEQRHDNRETSNKDREKTNPFQRETVVSVAPRHRCS